MGKTHKNVLQFPQKMQSPHIVTNRHGIRERGRVSAEFCPDAADGIPTTKSEAGNFGFCNGISKWVVGGKVNIILFTYDVNFPGHMEEPD